MTELDFLNETPSVPARRGLSFGSIVLLAGVVIAAVVFGLALIQRNQTQPTSGPAPDFTLTTLEGQQYRLADQKGKVVVVNFWASWCGPCRDEAPVLQSLWEKYKDKGVLFLGVAYTDTERGARAFMNEFGQNYPNGLDLGTKISEYYHITGVPETYVIDQQGNVAYSLIVPLSAKTAAEDKQLSPVLDRLLAKGAQG
jgi:cytochrome c biogenesis protein CcmG/thiol:disulfide interchange protein DsbE